VEELIGQVAADRDAGGEERAHLVGRAQRDRLGRNAALAEPGGELARPGAGASAGAGAMSTTTRPPPAG
jgi:hypothetical protein